MMISVMYKGKLSIRRRVLMIPWETFLRYQLRNTTSIALIGRVRGIVGGIGDTL